MARFSVAVLASLVVFGCDRGESRAEAPGTSSVDPAPAPLTLGARVPELTLRAHNGQTLELAKLGKPAVVYFYPKDDTPGCTIEAQEIRDLWKEIESTGAVVIGVSTDGAASHQAFAEKYELPFLLVPDEDHAIATAFGVAIKNGKAARVSFVLDASGRVSKVFPKVTPKGHGAELLAALGQGAPAGIQ
jgi:thioredoxin-dependent peroxiredoxin